MLTSIRLKICCKWETIHTNHLLFSILIFLIVTRKVALLSFTSDSVSLYDSKKFVWKFSFLCVYVLRERGYVYDHVEIADLPLTSHLLPSALTWLIMYLFFFVIKNFKLSLVTWTYTWCNILLRQEDYLQSEADLGDILSSRPVWTFKWAPVYYLVLCVSLTQAKAMWTMLKCKPK